MQPTSDWVLVLYGSCARGDADSLSDRDLLLLGNEVESAREGFIVNDATLVCYTWREFARMRAYGSLFLSHLARESLVLQGSSEGRRKFDSLTTALPPYERVQLDLKAFGTAIQDSRDALDSRDSSVEFELANLGTVIRHAAILGCHLMGHPRFNRYDAVSALSSGTASLGVVAKEFPLLYDFRLAVARGYPMPSGATEQYAQTWVTRAQLVIERVRRLATV